jgi:hypothetical protein
MAVFRIMFASDRFTSEPGMRNSNLLPVKANGLVRLRSVLSFRKFGRTWTPRSMATLWADVYVSSSPSISASTTRSSSSPRKMEMMAGGASLAPRRWSLPALATEMRSRSW